MNPAVHPVADAVQTILGRTKEDTVAGLAAASERIQTVDGHFDSLFSYYAEQTNSL